MRGRKVFFNPGGASRVMKNGFNLQTPAEEAKATLKIHEAQENFISFVLIKTNGEALPAFVRSVFDPLLPFSPIILMQRELEQTKRRIMRMSGLIKHRRDCKLLLTCFGIFF